MLLFFRGGVARAYVRLLQVQGRGNGMLGRLRARELEWCGLTGRAVPEMRRVVATRRHEIDEAGREFAGGR